MGVLPSVTLYQGILSKVKEMLLFIIVYSMLFIKWLVLFICGMLKTVELMDLMLNLRLEEPRLFLEPFILERKGLPRLANRAVLDCQCWSP